MTTSVQVAVPPDDTLIAWALHYLSQQIRDQEPQVDENYVRQCLGMHREQLLTLTNDQLAANILVEVDEWDFAGIYVNSRGEMALS